MTPQLDIFRIPRRLLWAAAVAVVALSGTAAAQETYHYDAETVDTAAHWAGRSTLANALMFSGLGEPVEVSMTELVRGDSHHGRAEVMAWCESNGIDCVFGLPGNRVQFILTVPVHIRLHAAVGVLEPQRSSSTATRVGRERSDRNTGKPARTRYASSA